MSQAPANTYDLIPYDSHAFRATHPDTLSSIAALFGMEPAPPDRCRVLELGCASGGNLIPMAVALPGSTFVGVDLSVRQIDDGHATLRALGLGNVSLLHCDLRDVDSVLGHFDYIVCHGVYSWVPREAQDRIMAICRELLAPQGVAYISYNTYPGWHLRATVREMMNYHAGHFDDPRSRIDQSRALLDFLVKAAPEDGSAYSRLLRDELQILRDRQDSYLFHEHLEEHNEPVYFYRFMERAAAAGLRFLGEASLDAMLPLNFSAEVQETLRRIAPDIIRMEQYMDFLRNRMFRRTLLCHEQVRLERDLRPEVVRRFHISSTLAPAEREVDFDFPGELVFQHPTGATVTVRSAWEKALLYTLWEFAPAGTTVGHLVEAARQRLGRAPADADPEQAACSTILNCYSAGLLDLRLQPDRFTTAVSQRPVTSTLVRHQAARGRVATNLRHDSVALGPFDAVLLPLLDGSRDRAALIDALSAAIADGRLVMHRNEDKVTDPDEVRGLTAQALEVALSQLAAKMLLVA
ncbi:MAG: methyltransferase regulatory domain-containing protein [Gammaproteobacteria bacterium]